MTHTAESRLLSRRAFLAAAGHTTLGITLLAACAPSGEVSTTDAGGESPAGETVEIRAHMVEKQDVSGWIEMGLEQDIDGFKENNPDISVSLETIPGWTPEYIPKILSFAAGGTLGDVVWFPPRHRSHIAWGTNYDVVTDLRPLAESAGYSLEENFLEGALTANSAEGKTYWLSFISEPIVPVIAYNKTLVNEMGLAEPTDEWTFDELAEWARSATTDDVFGYFRADRNGVFGGGPYYRQWGVEPTSEDGLQATFLENEEAFVNALRFNYDLMNTWEVSPSPTAGAVEAPELFGGQKVLAVDIWPFRIQIYPATFTDFEIDFVLTPKVNADDERRSMLNEHVFGITTASERPEAAFTFLSWVAGKEMNVQGLVQGQKGPIARADVWADDRVYESIPTYAKLRPIMENIEPDFLVANFRGDEFDQAFQQAYDALELGELQPEEAAVQIQDLCQAVLDKEPA